MQNKQILPKNIKKPKKVKEGKFPILDLLPLYANENFILACCI